MNERLNINDLMYRLKCGSECHSANSIVLRKCKCEECPYGIRTGNCLKMFAEDVGTLLDYMKRKGVKL